MNPALMQLRIELSNAKKDFTEKELKMKRLFWELQTFANPYYKTVETIKAEEILQCAKDMLSTKKELITLQEKVKLLKTDLGEN
ncbi:hypothetical protein IJ732_04235 [bacterium]|nr:hypothetical protein [bacterium]